MVEFLSWAVILAATGVMAWLFAADFRAIKSGETPKDFRAIIVAVGVVGTFLGILIGLWNFDSNNISGSVPSLLEGLKTAFITSVVGMALSVILGWKLKNTASGGEVEIDILNSIAGNVQKLGKIEKSAAHLDKMPAVAAVLESLAADVKAIHGSLASNQEEFLVSLSVKLDEIKGALNTAVETLGQGATKEIIKALEGVIADFNKNLTDQFGDNFKQLNAAVLQMIEWQNKYKEFVAEQQAKLDAAVKATGDNAAKIAEIAANYEKIDGTSKRLAQIIETNENQIKNLESHLAALKKIGDTAGEVSENINKFSDEIQRAVSNQSQAITKLSDELKRTAEKNLPESLRALNITLTSLTERFARDYGDFLEQMSKIRGR